MSFVPDPPLASARRSDSAFSQLLMVIEDSRAFLPTVLSQIDDAASLPSELRPGLSATRSLIPDRANALIAAVESGDYNRDLHEHSLGDADSGWQMKYAGYVYARSDLDRLVGERPLEGQDGVKKYLRWAKRPLRWLNVILGSLADVIPGAGGAYKELKEGTENLIEDALEEDEET